MYGRRHPRKQSGRGGAAPPYHRAERRLLTREGKAQPGHCVAQATPEREGPPRGPRARPWRRSPPTGRAGEGSGPLQVDAGTRAATRAATRAGRAVRRRGPQGATRLEELEGANPESGRHGSLVVSTCICRHCRPLLARSARGAPIRWQYASRSPACQPRRRAHGPRRVSRVGGRHSAISRLPRAQPAPLSGAPRTQLQS